MVQRLLISVIFSVVFIDSILSKPENNSVMNEVSFDHDVLTNTIPRFRLEKFGDRHYYFETIFAGDYHSAILFCKYHDMELLSIESKEENDFLWKHLQPLRSFSNRRFQNLFVRICCSINIQSRRFREQNSIIIITQNTKRNNHGEKEMIAKLRNEIENSKTKLIKASKLQNYPYTTRARGLLIASPHQTFLYQRSHLYLGPKLFDKLDVSIKDSKIISIFRGQLKEYLMEINCYTVDEF
ncbi:unnamed protein product [Phaedon cochleariae]|uniref:Uncharacterized protein n=1 Tax=Phaedon cochleariae TaxID=80249 RepID=A0A9N9SIF2_PHACE|nr:unnamed protein product [Phaedon cochleariae]